MKGDKKLQNWRASHSGVCFVFLLFLENKTEILKSSTLKGFHVHACFDLSSAATFEIRC